MAEPVRAWEERVIIPSYRVPPPDKNPMFLDKRVYQGSSGKIYPNAFTDRVSDAKQDTAYQAVYLENEYVRLMILPQIGGRIHIGQDKTNGYDFFYRQNVIKPALVGLLGPWISGGVEFNWPQHHRPSTFMPVEHSIEQHEDGSRTVWLTEHEPMNRMKSSVGICLRPGKSIIEAKVRLYNRTPFVETFLWWANAGIRVHDQYQAFFPPDVTFVADHAKRAMSWYPIARNFYYGVDYTSGVDISWYKNIPVPTSYMVTKSNYDFFGGYDHAQHAGVVHVANRHISPGKKLWTWGNAEFGYAWDRELTDSDGPYIELMAGVFTDNQPDFSWLHPYETRTFSQFWYPIREIGPAKNANRLVAVNLEANNLGVCATEPLSLTVVLSSGPRNVLEQRVEIAPGKPFVERIDGSAPDLLLRVFDQRGNEVIRHRPQPRLETELPAPATEPPPPNEIGSSDELYVTGLHLEQYRHATRHPEPYWEEALRRDPDDARCNNAMGLLHLRRGAFAKAEQHFRAAIDRLTRRNPNPYDGEPYYNLGLALRYQDRFDEAYAAFYKAAWNQPWQSAAYYGLATIDSLRAHTATALEHLDLSLRANADNEKAVRLKAALTGSDVGSTCEPFDAQTCLDYAFDHAEAGFELQAADLIRRFIERTRSQHPMLLYALASFDPAFDIRLASEAPSDYCFPARLEEMLVLESALRRNPRDAKAHYYLGNLLYDKWRREEGIEHWKESCRVDPLFSIAWRNLGIAYFNVRGEARRAMECYESAYAADPNDARLLYEMDQLRKRMAVRSQDRLAALEKRHDLVAQRDDLTAEMVTLYNQTGQSRRALEILSNRRFHPWEGGEGLISGQYAMAHFVLGREALADGVAERALEHFRAATVYPHNLGEGKHLLTPETHLEYYTAVALARVGKSAEAAKVWSEAAEKNAIGTSAYYRAVSLRSLRRENEAIAVLNEMLQSADARMSAEVKIDYFATSLPNFLLFEDDLQKRNKVECLFLRGLAKLGLGQKAGAAADLEEALRLDPNHLWAQLELADIAARREAIPS